MTQTHEELLKIAALLDAIDEEGCSSEIGGPLEAIKQAAIEVGKAFCGSWLGYHACVYYGTLRPIPAGAQFSPEWGLTETFAIDDTRGDWRQFAPEDIKRHMAQLAKGADITAAEAFERRAAGAFEDYKSDCISILMQEADDPFLNKIRAEIEDLQLYGADDVVKTMQPTGPFMSRDSLAMTQGVRVPPHIEAVAEVIALQHTAGTCKRLARFARQAGSHLFRKSRQKRRSETVGTNVFIGHGRSPLWKDLKDFFKDRLGLPYDEFNRVPAAGVANIVRLSEMLDAAAIAFLVMTGEDETAEGMLNARMNVIHEVGLFQGRLGFMRAIVLLEEGCEEFTNIQGLGQIRFPKGNIGAIFEEIRQVLEREGII